MAMDMDQTKLEHAEGLHQAGDLDGAADLYRKCLETDPKNPHILHMLGTIAFQKGNAPLGLSLIEGSLAQKDDMPFAWFNRSLILRSLNRKTEALQSARQALAVLINYPEAWAMVGSLLRELGEPQKAKEAHAFALTLRPENPHFKNDYAIDLLDLNDVKGAFQAIAPVVKADRDFVPLTLANILKAGGYPNRALPYFQRARDLLAGHADLRLNEATALLQMGDYDAGWKVFERRPDFAENLKSIPFWRGDKIAHLLVYDDQGAGDALHCSRYIAFLSTCVDRITLQVSKALHRLMVDTFPGIDVLSTDDAMPSVDARIRLMSLPSLFKTDLANIPPPVPLGLSNEMKKLRWDRPGSPSKPRIGIVWGGNPDNLTDRKRSMSIAFLAPLFKAVPGHWISLQKGHHAEGVDLASLGVRDAAPLLNDFAATAALMAELDLVITTCTSTAHLAGTLGIPTWVMLSFDPHWLWLLAREDSPWYPTMRLFRQVAPGDWTSVVDAVHTELLKLLAGDRSVLSPVRWTGSPARQNPWAISFEEDI